MNLATAQLAPNHRRALQADGKRTPHGSPDCRYRTLASELLKLLEEDA